MNDIMMVEVMNYAYSPPRITARFWWSQQRGLTCDHRNLLQDLEEAGINMPGGRRLYPRDGRDFFEALQFRFSSLERALPPKAVSEQGGTEATQ